ncbi:MAG: hypothetical protein JOZ38_10220 [Candidatus Eremiobacteraeota bacterium]|nr:hypothetical protein [Candidatus Eremiobacteraeota bacterium]
MIPGLGVEISPNGLVFAIEQTIAAEDFTVVCQIRDTKIPIRLRRVWADQVPHKGKQWNRYGCSFTGIAADHWDLIVRHVNDMPEPPKVEQEEQKPDDAYRLLPLAVQQKIVSILVEQNKLEQPREGQSPLVKLFYSGVQKKSDGTQRHRVHVHSRIKVNDEMMAYDTQFFITDTGDVSIK